MEPRGDERLFAGLRRAHELARLYPHTGGQPLPRAEEASPPEPDSAFLAGTHLGDFRLLRLIGEGGMGVVYLAEQLSLKRQVALKILPARAGLSAARQVQRFRREAVAAATLQHPGIVPVYAVGEERGVHFFAMEFIDGESLASLIRRMKELGLARAGRLLVERTQGVGARRSGGAPRSEFEAAAGLGLEVAEALAWAHAHGIIHRDIKPSNILLDRQGAPLLVDFGLARQTGAECLSESGEVAGTPQYMSFEQALGREDLDERTDIYSLGVTLYELLALSSPFPGSARHEVLYHLLHREPPRLRTLNRRVPRDLETILMTMMERDRERRYRSAAGLAADLRRFLEHRPIQARPLGAVARLGRFARRNPALTAAACLAALLVIGGPITFGLQKWMGKREVVAAWRQVELERSEKDRSLEEAEGNLSQLYLDRARWALGQATHSAAAVLAAASLQARESPQARGVLYRALAEAPCRLRWTWTTQGLPLHCAALSPDGRRAAVTCGHSDIVLLDAAEGRQLARLEGHQERVDAIAFHPRGNLLASASRDLTVRLWDLEAQGPPRTLGSIPSLAYSLSFSPDGRYLAVGAREGPVSLWHLQSGEKLPALEADGMRGVQSVAFSPGGFELAVGCSSGTVYLLDFPSGKLRSKLEEHAGNVSSIAYSPDGSLLACGPSDGKTVLWNRPSGELHRRTEGHQQPVLAVAYHPQGALFASGSVDETIRFWDPSSGDLKCQLTGVGSIRSLAFTSDGNDVLAGSSDGTVRLWRLTGVLPALQGHELQVMSVAFDPQGHGLFSASVDGTVRGWAALGGRSVAVRSDLPVWQQVSWDLREKQTDPEEPPQRAYAVAAGRGQLVAGGRRGALRRWAIPGGEELPQLKGHQRRVVALAFHSLTGRLASASFDGTVRLWDLESGQSVHTFENDCPDVSVPWLQHESRDPGKLAGKALGNQCVAVSRRGTLLAAGSFDGQLRLWDLGDLRPLRRWKASGAPLQALAFHPEDDLLVSASRETSIVVWDAETGKELRSFQGHREGVYAVLFLQGGQLASGSEDGTVRVWDFKSGRELVRLEGHTAPLLCLAASPDGRVLASGGEDREIRLWDLDVLARVALAPRKALLSKLEEEVGLELARAALSSTLSSLPASARRR